VDTQAGESDTPGNTGLVKGSDGCFTEETGWGTQCEWQWLARLPFEPLFARDDSGHWQRCQTLGIAAPACTKEKRQIQLSLVQTLKQDRLSICAHLNLDFWICLFKPGKRLGQAVFGEIGL
jgi:hypothetical protein